MPTKFGIDALRRTGAAFDITVQTPTGAADVRIEATASDDEIGDAIADTLARRERDARPLREVTDVSISAVQMRAAATLAKADEPASGIIIDVA